MHALAAPSRARVQVGFSVFSRERGSATSTATSIQGSGFACEQLREVCHRTPSARTSSVWALDARTRKRMAWSKRIDVVPRRPDLGRTGRGHRGGDGRVLVVRAAFELDRGRVLRVVERALAGQAGERGAWDVQLEEH